MAAYEPVRDPIRDDVFFMIFVDVPESVFLDSIRQQTMLSIGGGVLFATLLILVSAIVAKTLARPIHTLTAAAQAIEQDEAFEPESIADLTTQGDELGHLARVFRDMALAVQERKSNAPGRRLYPCRSGVHMLYSILPGNRSVSLSAASNDTFVVWRPNRLVT